MDIKVNGRTLSDHPLVLGVQGDNNVEELRFLIPRYTGSGVDLSLGIGYAVFRLPDGTDGHVSLTPEVMDTDENTVSLTLLVGSQMTEQKGSGKLCLKVAGLESAMWSSAVCDIFVGGTIELPSPQPYSLFRTMSVGPRLAEDESEPPLTVTERTINIPAELQTIAVAQDENSETVKIVVPRYFDGQDLSVHDFILHTEMGSNGTDDILFNNQNGQMKAVEDSTVTLTWVLRPPQTSYEGKLNIQLLVQGEEFKWHSLIGELTIAKHITGDPVVPATPSMYEQWLAELTQLTQDTRDAVVTIQKIEEQLPAIEQAGANAEAAARSAQEAAASAASINPDKLVNITGGTTGQFPQISGSGYQWAEVNQVPQGGASGQVLTATGSGYQWSDAPVQSVNSKTGTVTLGAADVGAVPLNHTAVLADGIALKDGSPVNTPADIDQYTVLRIYSNYGAAVCSVPIKGGQTGFLPFINGTSAPNINIVVVNISRTETQLTLETNAALRLATTGITAPGTALSVYRIEGLV